MKLNTTLKLLFIVIMSTTLNTIKVSAQETKAEKEVAESVEQLRKAMISADSTTLSKLASTALSYGHSGGKIQNKAEFIKSFTSRASVFVSIDLTDQTIHVEGNTAIVRHILSAATNDTGKGPGTVKIAVLLVWVKSRGGWQLLARQAVKV